MALRQNANGSALHFWVRAAGLTGLAILAVGLVVLLAAPDQGAAGANPFEALYHRVLAFPEGLKVGDYLLAVGAVLLVLALLIELPSLVRLASSNRAALGSNVFLQIALAVVLLVGINVFSFYYHLRFDLTRDGIFTIDPAIRQQLAGLRGETTIVLYQRHSSFGQPGEKSDNYDAAAERQIVEKVKDLVEEFRELGPRFRVEVLDIQDEGYQDKLAALKKEAPALGNAIESAPENSIFFYSRADSAPGAPENSGAVQRLSFHDIYHLDKQASRQADGGRGNLVLRSQGVKPFANRILNIDEKKPRVAVAVIHELLGLDDPQDWGMGGAKNVLTARGFASKDIVLKKWSEIAMPEPAVLTYDESKYERLDEEISEADTAIKDLTQELNLFRQHLKEWQTKSLAELSKTDIAKNNRITQVNEDIRQEVIQQLQPNIALREMILKQARQERQSAAKEQAALNVENLSEQRRIADLRAKFNRMLGDVDLLIVPRMTLRNVARNEAIPNSVHGLDPAQLDAIKDFMKAGKPVLFCLGPANESPSRPPFPGMAPDHLEDMLSELGIKMPKQTILFNSEAKSFAERRSGFIVLGNPTEVPPMEFDWPPGAGQVKAVGAKPAGKPNAVRESMRLAAGSFGSDLTTGLRLRHPRPVYYEPARVDPRSPDAVFMMTSPEAWNENQPFPTREHIPRFQPPKPGDPDVGTVREERRGQFPVAVAVETRLPASWYEGKDTSPATVRLAVIGQGEVFSGATLNLSKEKLLLDVSNWLLGRDDLLAHADAEPWQYPRVSLSESENALWQWGTRLGLPLFFIYLGLMVFMVRRMR
jgi:hypothetical protein